LNLVKKNDWKFNSSKSPHIVEEKHDWKFIKLGLKLKKNCDRYSDVKICLQPGLEAQKVEKHCSRIPIIVIPAHQLCLCLWFWFHLFLILFYLKFVICCLSKSWIAIIDKKLHHNLKRIYIKIFLLLFKVTYTLTYCTKFTLKNIFLGFKWCTKFVLLKSNLIHLQLSTYAQFTLTKYLLFGYFMFGHML